MNNKRCRLISLLLIIGSILIFIGSSCETNNILISNPEFTGEYKLNYNDLPSLDNNSEFKLGGFSSLDYIGRREFVTVTNGGPRVEQNGADKPDVKYLAPEFEPEIVTLKLKDGNISIKNRIKIKNLFGTIYNGIPDQKYISDKINFTNKNINTDIPGIDPEAITFDPYNNCYWLGEMYKPGILQAAGRWGDNNKQIGNILRCLKPYEGLRSVYQNQIANGGLSGLDLLNNKTMIGVFKKYLKNYPIEVDSLGNIHVIDTLELYKNRRRIVKINPKGISVASNLGAFYEVMDENFDGVKPEDVRIGDIAVINDTTCLINEYGETGGNKRNLLVKAILPDSIWFSSLKEGVFGKSIETLTPHELDSASLAPAVKRNFVDLSVEMESPPTGIAILDNKKVALLEKNNFGLDDNQDPDNYDIKKEDIIIKILNFDELF